MEVPLNVAVAVFDVYQADGIDDPGANMSRQVPMLENDDRASVLVVEPVVMALTARAGEKLQAFAPLLLPAATAIVTLALCRLLTAVSSEVEIPPPRLMLATAGAM